MQPVGPKKSCENMNKELSMMLDYMKDLTYIDIHIHIIYTLIVCIYHIYT